MASEAEFSSVKSMELGLAPNEVHITKSKMICTVRWSLS